MIYLLKVYTSVVLVYSQDFVLITTINFRIFLLSKRESLLSLTITFFLTASHP